MEIEYDLKFIVLDGLLQLPVSEHDLEETRLVND
jgi:hypothetical protein